MPGVLRETFSHPRGAFPYLRRTIHKRGHVLLKHKSRFVHRIFSQRRVLHSISVSMILTVPVGLPPRPLPVFSTSGRHLKASPMGAFNSE
jgi:hypothetical protein